MNADLRRFLRLYKQQFWLFGYDVRRQQGNLLIEMGFQRTPVPEGERLKSSRYHRTMSDGSLLTLWSFGACWSSVSHGSIFVSRLDPRPRYSTECLYLPDAWFTDQLGAFKPAHDLARRELATNVLLDLLA